MKPGSILPRSPAVPGEGGGGGWKEGGGGRRGRHQGCKGVSIKTMGRKAVTLLLLILLILLLVVLLLLEADADLRDRATPLSSRSLHSLPPLTKLQPLSQHVLELLFSPWKWSRRVLVHEQCCTINCDTSPRWC